MAVSASASLGSASPRQHPISPDNHTLAHDARCAITNPAECPAKTSPARFSAAVRERFNLRIADAAAREI
jgi:hypothetical protein